MAEKTNDEKSSPVEQQRLEQEQIEDLGSIWRTRGKHAIHCLTVVGQVEGHVEAPQGQKTTKYEHVIPQLVAVQEDPGIDGLLVLLNTVGGDVEAGLALAELIASISKPSAAVVLGGGHSIGIPLAVSARRSFIVPTATMTIHPVRHSGMILGVPQTMRWFEQMQERITGFVAAHSGMTEKRYTELMLRTGELVMDVGTVLDGRKAVREKLIDQLGGISDALEWLYQEIEKDNLPFDFPRGTMKEIEKYRNRFYHRNDREERTWQNGNENPLRGAADSAGEAGHRTGCLRGW